ncbi:MAG: HD domain-containing protein [Nitrososphaerales archaeon]
MEEKIKSFVKTICSERDVSHDFAHMEKVAENSMLICEEMNLLPSTVRLVKICAWLHDVNDHKYPSTLDRLTIFLNELCPELTHDVLLVIDHVSFSKERKLFGDDPDVPRDWNKVFNNEELVLVRNIVSDADKLEALGQIGIERALQFAYAQNPQITTRKSLERIIVHADEKLNHLIDYFTTEPGKILAKPLHNEMQMILDTIRTMLRYTGKGNPPCPNMCCR